MSGGSRMGPRGTWPARYLQLAEIPTFLVWVDIRAYPKTPAARSVIQAQARCSMAS